jgi:hypothetical protein
MVQVRLPNANGRQRLVLSGLVVRLREGVTLVYGRHR